MRNSQLKVQEGPKNWYSFVKSIFRSARFLGANFRPHTVVLKKWDFYKFVPRIFLFLVLRKRGWDTIWSELIYIHSWYVASLRSLAVFKQFEGARKAGKTR